MSKDPPKDLVEFGEIRKPHGLRGDLKVHFYHPIEDFPMKGDCIWLDNGIELTSLTEFQVEHLQLNSPQPIIKFNGVNNRDDANILRGAQLFIPRSNLPELEGDSFYYNDLIGCFLENENGEKIGTIQNVLALPGNDVLVVDYRGNEVLVPLVDEFIKLIDIENKLVIMNLLEGLLDQ